MLGLVRLQITDAAPLLAPGAAGHLMQQLKCALGRARVPVRESQVGVDHAHQVKLGKVMSLGHQLRSDDDVETPFGNVVEFLAQPLNGFDEIARQHQDAAARK